MAIVFLGIGSNLGDRKANIERAIVLLKENENIEVLAVSDLIETEPEGGPQGQEKYWNGAIKIQTQIMPLELLSHLKNIERRLGRKKDAEPNSPRPVDLDILFYGDVVIIDGKRLTIPHPRLASRRFVLEPLSELAPDWVHPQFQKTVKELLDSSTSLGMTNKRSE
ncbi:MAG: 2-amino-4-hydroxy-6-hydroxymethyldihydropteridine diphosphokinase [Candidatus Omnitrophica bacterium]|nr:2-amino-4-hydroxy-6-hydroxymethyldihydropteridine diphosphokinase [Candidatus Omnitrophota bacterium]